MHQFKELSELLDPGLIDDLFERVHFLGQTRPARLPVVGAHQEAVLNILSFISCELRTLSVSVSSHLTFSGSVLAGAKIMASVAKTKSG